MKTVEEYKHYIWRQIKSKNLTKDDILAIKPNTENSNWNAALKQAQEWAVKEPFSKICANDSNPESDTKVDVDITWLQGFFKEKLEPENESTKDWNANLTRSDVLSDKFHNDILTVIEVKSGIRKADKELDSIKRAEEIINKALQTENIQEKIAFERRFELAIEAIQKISDSPELIAESQKFLINVKGKLNEGKSHTGSVVKFGGYRIN